MNLTIIVPLVVLGVDTLFNNVMMSYRHLIVNVSILLIYIAATVLLSFTFELPVYAYKLTYFSYNYHDWDKIKTNVTDAWALNKIDWC